MGTTVEQPRTCLPQAPVCHAKHLSDNYKSFIYLSLFVFVVPRGDQE